MALPHARPLDVIDLAAPQAAEAGAPSTSLLKTAQLELLHLVLPARHSVPAHHLRRECTLHCLHGDVDVDLGRGALRLGPGQLVLLPAEQSYALNARVDSVLLMTLLLPASDDTQRTADPEAAPAAP